MSTIGQIALSGMQAAARRIAVSAENVVNARTSRAVEVEGETPEGVYEPRRVVQIPLEGGGVRVALTTVNPSTLVFADFDSPTGLVAVPNVDLARELVEQKLALRDYKSSLAALEAEAEMMDALLDIKS